MEILYISNKTKPYYIYVYCHPPLEKISCNTFCMTLGRLISITTQLLREGVTEECV